MGRRIKPYDIPGAEVVDAASDGRAVVRHDGKVIFIDQGVPGDIVDVHVYRKHKKLPIGRITAVVEPSADRIEPRCQHFGICGGCKWQMMTYEAQLRYKQKQVEDAFERIAKVEVKEKFPILGVETPYFYRNKLEFSFSDRGWLTPEQMKSDEVFDQPALGFHVQGIFDKSLNIETCYLQKPIVNDVRNALRDLAIEQGIPFYNTRAHTGFLRELMFRSSEHTGELMVTLIVAADKPELVDQLLTPLKAQFPAVTDWLWIVNEKLNNSYNDLPYRVWSGKDYITERLGTYDFRMSPTSFFQTNPKQAQNLYQVAKDMLQAVLPAGASKHELVYDLYSGTGSIGIFVSDLAEKIVGIEYVEPAVADAKKNVSLNGLSHFSFYAGDMRKLLRDELVQKEGNPSVVIADPPRAGMDHRVVEQLLRMTPNHIIYVSCKPATQARDVALLSEKYEVLQLQPVDMFPHTAHVENVVLLGRKKMSE